MSEPVAGLVSVIVPVYNGERFLRQALDSIAAQDYQPIELIIVDDGSGDATPRIACDFSQARYVRQENQGCGPAKNTGIGLARGEFAAFLDADDLWLPHKLRRQVEVMRQHPQAGFTIGLMEIFLEPGFDRPAWLPQAHIDEPQPVLVPSALMIRRSVLDAIGVFDPAYPICNDFDWVSRARDAGVAQVVTPDVLVRRRMHSDNLTHRVNDRAREVLRITAASLRRKKAPALAATRSATSA